MSGSMLYDYTKWQKFDFVLQYRFSKIFFLKLPDIGKFRKDFNWTKQNSGLKSPGSSLAIISKFALRQSNYFQSRMM